MQKILTSFDVAAVVMELKEQLRGARIQNIYHVNPRTLVLKLHQPAKPTSLLIEAGKRLHLTSFLLRRPRKPTAFCMALRKFLRNGAIVEVDQYEFERIVVLEARTKGGDLKLVLELFGDGNIILVDSQSIIKQALTFRRMRDRTILRGELFQHAPLSGINPLRLKASDLSKLQDFGSLELVRALTKLLSIGGTFAEEILLRSQVNKEKRCESLEDTDIERISSALKEVLSPLHTKRVAPRVIVDTTGRWIDVVPIMLMRHSELESRRFKSFNEALDEYYAKATLDQETVAVAQRADQELARQQRILQGQQETLEAAREEAARFATIGDSIYAHFHHLQTLHKRIMEEKRSGKKWEEIILRINDEKKRKKIPSTYFESVETRKLILNVSVKGIAFPLSLRKSVQENAKTYYERSKKAKKKIKGAERAIQETSARIKELKKEKKSARLKTVQPIIRKRKRAWYEKFRWFHTSEKFLVIGGKDAVTNEILIKKHVKPHDLIFHADIAGAPFVVIKTKGRTPTEQSIDEAAQLAASHSRAWKAGFSAIDVYWVHPEQVSKTPPSGEYLKKGAFTIRGKRNYVRRAPIKLAIGVDAKTSPPKMVGGPEGAVRSRTGNYVNIIPGNVSSGKLANQIRSTLERRVSKNLKGEVSRIPIEEIQIFIPYGKGRISEG